MRQAETPLLGMSFLGMCRGKWGIPTPEAAFIICISMGSIGGIYQTQERAEASFAETYLGGDSDDYDVVKSYGDVTDGNRDAYSRLWEEAMAGFGPGSEERYWRIQGLNADGTPNGEFERLLDVDNLIDYMIITYWTGDVDGPGSRRTDPDPNNYFAIFNRAQPDGFKFFEHDSEISMDVGDENLTVPFTSGGEDRYRFNPHWLHEQLVASASYRSRFSERVDFHLYHDGVLSSANALDILQRRVREIDQAIIAESARWGDSQREVPYTRESWLGAIEGIESWIDERRDIVVEHFKARGWIPSLTLPELSVAPGPVPLGTRISFQASEGSVYYSLDGSDPRDLASAIEASPAGLRLISFVEEGVPARAIVPTDGSLGTEWWAVDFDHSAWLTGLTGIGFDGNPDFLPYIGMDVGDDMIGKNTSVFIRIPFEIDDPSVFTKLRYWMRFDDGFVARVNGAVVALANTPDVLEWNSSATSGRLDIIASDWSVLDISHQLDLLRPGNNVLTIHGLNGGLESSDLLFSPRLEAGFEVQGDEIDLPAGRITVKASTRVGDEWSRVTESVFLVGHLRPDRENLVVSELMYQPAPATDEEVLAGFKKSDFEYIELLNIGAAPIGLDDLFFIEGINFRFPVGSELKPNERGLLVKNTVAFNHRYGLGLPILGEFTGSFSNQGERIALVRSWDQRVLDFTYNDAGGWSTSADGSGRSLVLVDPFSAPNLSDPESWLASQSSMGAPGEADPGMIDENSFAQWKSDLNIDDGLGDNDNDGLTNILEYAFGSDPFKSESQLPIVVREDNDMVALSHQVNSTATDVVWHLQGSRDLVTWDRLEVDSNDITDEPLDDVQLVRNYSLQRGRQQYLRLLVEVDGQ